MSVLINEKTRVLIFATWWAQAGELKPGMSLRLQATDSSLRATGPAIDVRLVARKNLGAYGSGCSELIVETITRKNRLGVSSGRVIRSVVAKPLAPSSLAAS